MCSIVLAAMLTTGEVTPNWGLHPSPSVPVTAPPPGYDPSQFNYNYDRAYRHILSSPSGLKTFSSLGQSYGQATITPFGYRSSYQEAGYEHQRVGPSGWERYQYVPGRGGSFATPFSAGAYRVSGYSISSSGPPHYLP
jgi:hypothetical protein